MAEQVDNEVNNYKFPLRDGLTIKLIGIPTNITRNEIDRIHEFISVLCVEKQNIKSETQRE